MNVGTDKLQFGNQIRGATAPQKFIYKLLAVGNGEKIIYYSSSEAKGWYTVIAIEAEDIAFKEIDNIEEPECIIRLKMAT